MGGMQARGRESVPGRVWALLVSQSVSLEEFGATAPLVPTAYSEYRDSAWRGNWAGLFCLSCTFPSFIYVLMYSTVIVSILYSSYMCEQQPFLLKL